MTPVFITESDITTAISIPEAVRRLERFLMPWQDLALAVAAYETISAETSDPQIKAFT
jgi:hypothetical protein